MADAFAKLQGQGADLSHAEWLGQLIDREASSRSTRRFQSATTSTHIPVSAFTA